MHPILFSLGPITIRSYGVLLTLAFILGTFIVWREGKRQGYNEEKILDLAVTVLVTGFIGARLYYVILNWSDFASNLLKVLMVWEGGLAFHGALAGGIIGAWYFIKKAKWPFFQVADFAVLGLTFGQAVGRIGCLLNGDDYGVKTDLPWGVHFPGLVGERHPTQAYEAIWLFLTFLILRKIYKRKTLLPKSGGRSGVVFFTYLIFSGLGRFLIEFYRADTTVIDGVKVAHLVSMGIMVVGLVGLYWLSNRSWRRDLGKIYRFFHRLKVRIVQPRISKLK
jgi:phosphatidylglycerol:prolipoprotein diacylglycerol transferase